MRAEIISIGTELLLGTITDTNASYLAQRLAGLGIGCYYVSQVGDNLERLKEVLVRAWDRSDLIVTTGGLGPTQDDLTREAIAALLGEEMLEDPDLARHLLGFFTSRGLRMPEGNKKQATLIPSATTIPNPVGTAPGWWTVQKSEVRSKTAESGISLQESPQSDSHIVSIIVSMPGVPFEMKRMWEREVEPKLRALSPSVIVSRTVKIMGLGESRVEEVVKDLMAGSNPTLAPYAKSDGIHLRMTARAESQEEALELIDPLESAVRSRLGDAIYGVDDDTPQSVVGRILDDLGYTLAVVEIGEGAIGSVSALLGAHPLCLGTFGGREIAVVASNMGSSLKVTGDQSLAQLALAARESLGADVVVGISVALQPRGDDGSDDVSDDGSDDVSVVKFQAEIVISAGQHEQEGEPAIQSWRVVRSEVGRLAGLAALNQLRQRLVRESSRLQSQTSK